MVRFTVATLALSTLATTGTSLYLWSALQAEREATRAALRRTPEPLSARPALPLSAPSAPPAAAVAPAPPSAAAEQRPVPVREPGPVRSVPFALAAAAGGINSTSPEDARRQFLARLADPAARAAMVRQQVAGMQRMMPDLGETLGLDDAGVERFLTALSEAQLRETERRASLGPAGSAFGAGTNPRAAVEESLAADFGADTVARWREYQAALPARSMVRNLQMSLVDADLALSKDQRQQMVGVYGRAMTEATPAQVPGSVRVAGPAAAGMVRPPALAPEQLAEMRTRQIEMVQARNARISQEARSILSTEQQAVLERHLRSELDMQRQAFEMMSSSRPAAAAPPP